MNEPKPGHGPASDTNATPADEEGVANAQQHRSESLAAIQATDAVQAATLDQMAWTNRLLVGRYRRHLFKRTRGRVLDVTCGAGTNVRYVPETAGYVGIDVRPAMVYRARERVRQFDATHEVVEIDAQALAVPDDSFETVISSLSTCTVPDRVILGRGKTGGPTLTSRNTAVAGITIHWNTWIEPAARSPTPPPHAWA